MNEIIKEDIDRIRNNLGEIGKDIEGRTFLVTGGAGFLGSWFCDILDSFNAKVICVDNLSSGSMDNIAHLAGSKNFSFFEEDVCEFNTDIGIDYIVHMASIASPSLYQKLPIETLDSNIMGTKRMLEMAARKKVKGFLFTSTSEVYGDPAAVPTPETYYGNVNSYGPRSMYDEGKRAAEAYCYSFFKGGVPVRISRIFNTYGPRLDTKNPSAYGRVITRFIHLALAGEPITVYGDGTQTRSFTYITDLIESMFRLLMKDGINGSVVNLGSDDERSILDVATMIKDMTDSPSIIVFKDLPKDDPKRRCPDITLSKDLIGFKQKINIDEGLERTIRWHRQSTKGITHD